MNNPKAYLIYSIWGTILLVFSIFFIRYLILEDSILGDRIIIVAFTIGMLVGWQLKTIAPYSHHKEEELP